MALLASILGLGLALIAALGGRPFAAFIGVYPLAAGAIAILLGTMIGARGPRFASGLFRGALLIVLAVGAIAGALGIWLAALLTQAQGPSPTPWASALGAAAGGIVTAAVTKLQGLAGLMPDAIAQRMTTMRYGARFPSLAGTPTPAFRAAYEAIQLPMIQRPGDPPIKGWGYGATARRLELIRAAL